MTAACESMPPPGRSRPALRPPRLPVTPTRCAHVAPRTRCRRRSDARCRRSTPSRPAPLRSARDAERGCARQELHAAAERIAAVLRARRTAKDLDRLERFRLDQIEKRVHAAALRAVRIAHAVDEDVDLVARQPAHEDAGHRRARPLEVNARLPFTACATTVLTRAAISLCVDDVDRLAGQADVLDGPARRRHRDFFAKAGRIDDDLERRRSLGRRPSARDAIRRRLPRARRGDSVPGAGTGSVNFPAASVFVRATAVCSARQQPDFRGAHRARPSCRARRRRRRSPRRRGDRRQGHHETHDAQTEHTTDACDPP